MAGIQNKTIPGQPEAITGLVRYAVIAVLIAVLCIEGYYIFLLKETIQKQTEDLRNISVQLQLLKSEREILNEEISSAQKQSGEKNDGNTTQR